MTPRPRTLPRPLLRPVDATLRDGRFAAHQQAILELYLSVPDDDYLLGFRRRRGLPAPGTELGGWYGGGVYHVFGQVLGGFARLHRATGDPRPREKALALLRGWDACVEEDGYALYNPRGQVFDPHYEYEKLLGGLLDCLEILQAPCEEGIRRISGWAAGALDRSGPADPGRNDDHREWHTLPENLYRAYDLLGDPLFREMAEAFEYPFYWNRFLDPAGFAFEPRHAYSHVNNLGGAAMAFRVRGDPRYRDLCVRAYDEITAHHLYATGGYGPAERMFAPAGYLGDALLAPLERGFGHCEIACCSFAVFKLTGHLLGIAGEARFADWAEQMMHNVLAAQPVPHPPGFLQYYAEYYRNGGSKRSSDGRIHEDGLTYEWPCCSGTLPEAVADYSRLVFAESDTALHVCQYVSADCDTPLASAAIRTGYPLEDDVRLVLSRRSEALREVALRIPGWCDGFEVQFGDRCIRARSPLTRAPDTGVPDAAGQPGPDEPFPVPPDGWLRIPADAIPEEGITIRIRQPVVFRPVDEAHPDLAALVVGPLAYAADQAAILAPPDGTDPPLAPAALAAALLEPRAPDGTIDTKPGAVVHYPMKRLRFRPLAGIPEGVPYYLYLGVRNSRTPPDRTD